MARCKINTLKLQELIRKSLKGSSNERAIPITQFLEFKLEGNILTLKTTNGKDYLWVSMDGVEGDDMAVCLNAELLSKLIMKTTSETMSFVFNPEDLSFTVTGNGTYQMSLLVDEEEGDGLISYPNPEFKQELAAPSFVVSMENLNAVIASNRAALAKTSEMASLMNYYFDLDKVITCDSNLVCSNRIESFSTQMLIPPELMNLISIIDSKTCKVSQYDGLIRVTNETGTINIYGETSEDLQNYPIDAINGFLNADFEKKCKIRKSDILSVLDRIALFIDAYDENSITLTFDRQGVIVYNRGKKSNEVIQYVERGNWNSLVSMNIEVNRLISAIQSQPGDVLDISYENPAEIKIESGNITYIVSLYANTDEIQESAGYQDVPEEE